MEDAGLNSGTGVDEQYVSESPLGETLELRWGTKSRTSVSCSVTVPQMVV